MSKIIVTAEKCRYQSLGGIRSRSHMLLQELILFRVVEVKNVKDVEAAGREEYDKETTQ